MDILLYLSELLETRKTVGIVGLGTLYKKKSAGKYDAEKHAFIPPSYSLAFTTEVREQEELASYISQKRNITIDSANYYIGEFAERIQNELADQQEANFAPIGQLKLVNDEITLISDQKSNIGFEFYGLPEIAEAQKDPTATIHPTDDVEENMLQEIEEENRLEEENPGQEIEENVLANDEQEIYEEIAEVQQQEKTYHHLNDSPPIIETVEKEEKIEPVEEVIVTQQEVDYDVEEEETKAGMPFFMKFLIAFLIIVALGAIVYFINPQFFNNYFNKNFDGKPEQVVPTTPNDSLTNQLDTNTTDTLALNNDLVKLNKDTVTTNAIDSSKVIIYEVLVSAVATEKKANKIIANLNKEGVAAKKIKLSRTMINISAGSFLTEWQARNYRDSLRIKLKNQGIYIQPIKPKTHKK